MLEYIVIIGLIMGAGFYVISPLLNPDRSNGSYTAGTGEVLDELMLQKEDTYATIRELEFDLNMGKLSKEDFETLKGKYTRDAVDCLKAIDKLHANKNARAGLPEKDLENEIEREISALRANGSGITANVFCAQCGNRATTQDRFCSKCGAKLMKP